MVEPRREMARLLAHGAFLERQAGVLPGGQAAFQNMYVGDAEGAQRPPHARRGEQAIAVVDDGAHAVAQPHGAHGARKGDRVRQHVRQRRLLVGNFVDVEMDRAGNVPGQIFRLRIAVERRQVPARVDQKQVGGREMLGEPFGRHEMLMRAVARHGPVPVRFLTPDLARTSLRRQGLRRPRRRVRGRTDPGAGTVQIWLRWIRQWGDEAMNPTTQTSGLAVPMLSVLSVLMATAWLVVH